MKRTYTIIWPLYVKFPSGFLARQFTSKRFSEDLNDLFDNFSYFSHSYPDSWQIAPGTSILEYKVFTKEFSRFSEKVENILKSYRGYI